jgi:N-acetylglucosamine-6-phosphate deacetylase
MNPERWLYGRAFLRGEIAERVAVGIQDGKIVDVADDVDCPAGAARYEGLLAPGFVDLHVHGGDGADFMDGNDIDSARILRFHARHGTTALAATTLSGTHPDLLKAAHSIARVATLRPEGAEICGIHLEGPYINRDRAGAQAKQTIRPADIHELAELHEIAPQLRWIVTLAPEIEGAHAVMEHFAGRMLFSIGHTAATYGETVAGLEWGARHFTHLFNAMPPLHHREPGPIGAAMISTDATAELIADGVHVHPAVLRMAVQSMSGRIALVTDAVRACGMPDGTYTLYGQNLTLADGAARLDDGTLAGSVLTMSRAVQNMVELAGFPVQIVLPLATEIPARILGVGDRKGKIEVGYDADLVVISSRFAIDRVFLRGMELADA